MFDDLLANIKEYLYIIPASLFAVMLHEIAHGFVSYLLGDPTAKNDGRFTLNPLKHLDFAGIICMIFFHIGWAKPVQVNPNYYKKPKLGMTLVALAGPLTNLFLAFFSGFIYVLFVKLDNLNPTVFYDIVSTFFLYSLILNIGLGLFNLIPIPPLDGSKILGILIPDEYYDKYMSYQKYGLVFMFVLILVLDGVQYLGGVSIISTCIEFFSNLVVKFWALILF